MQGNELLQHTWEALLQHMPAGATWLPWAATAGVAVFGLILLVRGARLARGFVAVALLGAGAVGGLAASGWLHTPWLPTSIVAGALGLALGLIFFRVWLGAQLVVILMLVALGVYGARSLGPALQSFQTDGLDPHDAVMPVSLAQPGESPAVDAQPAVVAAALWKHLSAQVPSFQPSFFAIIAATLVVGTLLTLLLPKFARALWAATLGTALVGTSAWFALDVFWPQFFPLAGRWAAVALAGVWGAGLIWNLVDVIERKPRVTTEDPEPATA